MSSSGKADFIIQNLAGCGVFQVVLVFFVFFLGHGSVAMSMMFMAFGLYNPGWRCLDNNINNITNSITTLVDGSGINITSPINTGISNNISQGPDQLMTGNCVVFEACQNIQFDPDTSTIVTEWGLVCSRSWIASLIVSVQMAGVLVGSILVGHLGDSIGRKPTIYGAQAALVVLNIISIFSTCWEMFAVVRFFLGIGCASILSLFYVFPAEFITIKWRAVLGNIPAWSLAAMLYGVAFMMLRDWRHLHIVAAAMTFASVLPVFWVPESLRWLEVKNKRDSFICVAKKVLKMNGKALPLEEHYPCEDENSSRLINDGNSYTILDVFRRGYWVYALITGLEWFIVGALYYALSFGVKSLYGSFYVNFIILYGIDIPFKILQTSAIQYLSRRGACITLLGATSAALLVAAGFKLSPWDQLHKIGITVLIMTARQFTYAFWIGAMMHTSEVYPTVVRSLALNWGSFMARVGGILAPFLIPNDPETAFIPYIAMGALGIVCCVAILKLPETKGKPLPATFDDCKTADGVI